MTPCHRTKLARQGKGHHEVLDGQELGSLAVEPSAGFMVLTPGAAAMPAGSWLSQRRQAVGALQLNFTGFGGSATQYRVNRLAMTGQ
jgi:hypothetical protein